MRILAIITCFIFISISTVYSSQEISERLDKAKRLSWDKRYKESIEILKGILDEEPSNIDARIHLARVLSWMGRLKEAEKECDIILREYPQNHDALLIKANILRWSGDNIRALRIYRRLLERDDEFDTRLAMTYGLLNTGDIKKAIKSMEKLKVLYPYQEKEYNELKETIDEKKRQSHDIGGGYTYYSDSDDNRVNKYDLRYDLSIMNLKAGIKYSHINAEDNTRDKKADILNFQAYYRFNESTGAGINGGITSFDGSNYPHGSIHLDISVPSGDIRIYSGREPITNTAGLIEKKIRYDRYGITSSGNLSSTIRISSNFEYREYSDSNNAIDLSLNAIYSFYKREGTSLGIGYRFRFMDYKRQSYGGYFDPDNFISHQIIIPFYYEKERIYITLEPYTGIQRYSRYGETKDEYIAGGYLSSRYNIKKGLSIELNLEGGNYGAETQTGWKYYMVGIRIILKPVHLLR